MKTAEDGPAQSNTQTSDLRISLFLAGFRATSHSSVLFLRCAYGHCGSTLSSSLLTRGGPLWQNEVNEVNAKARGYGDSAYRFAGGSGSDGRSRGLRLGRSEFDLSRVPEGPGHGPTTSTPPQSVFGGEGLTLFSSGQTEGQDDGGGGGIGVNSYLWRASLDTIAFMPLASADPFGGVIITDWYSPPRRRMSGLRSTS